MALAAVNWGFETLKFKRMLTPFFELSFKSGYQAILSGVLISLFFPNRTTEFAGRLAYIPMDRKQQATMVTLFGGLAQLLITLFLGTVAVWFFTPSFPAWFTWFLRLSGLIGTLIGVFLYFIPHAALSYVPNAAKRFIPSGIEALKGMPTKLKWEGIGWSMIRYAVFAHQFYLLLAFMGFHEPRIALLAPMATYFLAQTLSPSFILADLGIRGVLAGFIFSSMGSFPEGATLAAWMLWLMNVLLPGIVGWIMVLMRKT